MIYYLLMLGIPLMNCLQSVSQKQYNLKYEKPNVILFSAVTSMIALCFFLVTSRFQLSFDARLIPYSLGFAVGYSAGWVGTVLAVRYGLMAISSLIVNCSLIFPTAYGIMLGEPVTPLLLTGVALLLASFVLVNLKFEEGSRFSWKWFGCVMVAFFGNGLCAVTQNMHKRALGDAYGDEFMIIALAAASAMLLVIAMLTSRDIRGDFKGCVPYSALNGVSNGIINFLVLILIGNVPNTVLYPTNAATSMIAAFLLSYIVYKERFSKVQYIGYALGIVSIVMLNI